MSSYTLLLLDVGFYLGGSYVELNCFVIFQNKTSFCVQVSLMMNLHFVIGDLLDGKLRLLIKCDISLRRALDWSMLLYDSLSGVMFES